MTDVGSAALFERAQKVIPGGVNSPVRAFRGVGGTPRFLARGAGARIWDVDGNEYVDYIGSWGPLIIGHAHPQILAAVAAAAANGTTFGAPTEREVLLAEKICSLVPSIEQVRLCSSGSEATMSAIRLARGFTGRNRIIKIDGGYHGHADALLVAAGSGAATLGIPGSAGVPAGAAADTFVVAWNDLEAMRTIFAAVAGGSQAEQIAAVLIEPVCGNMGCVPPAPGYLAGLRELTTQHGALLIFDEVMTGFRIALGGAQAHLGIVPDLTCLGKVVGGGLPLAAFGGRLDVMASLAPVGPVYQAGTLSGNPLAVAAGLKTLELLESPGVYARLDQTTAELVAGLQAAADRASVPVQINRVGSMFTCFFTAAPVTDFATAKNSDTARFARLFHHLLAEGVYFPPSQFEAAFVSLAHGEDGRAIEQTISAFSRGLQNL